MEKYDYFNGSEWLKVDKEDIQKQLFDYGNIDEIMEECGGKSLMVRYANGKEIHWHDVHGTWGNPTRFR